MNFRQQYILSLLSKFSLVLLYISFFTVQLFFNFDTGSHSDSIVGHSISKKENGKYNQGKLIAGKKNTTGGKRSGFRLNKRYQPATAASCKGIVIKPFVCFVTSKQHIHYRSGFIAASIPPVHSLRGPPVVV
jgi:hypothetical protein